MFGLRESRILWGVEGLEYFDLAYWGIKISEGTYTLQNMIGILGGIILLLWLTQSRSPEIVLSQYVIHAPDSFSGRNPKRHIEGQREKKSESPLKLVFKAKDEEPTEEEK